MAVAPSNGGSAARPQLIRALNEQLLLEHIRRSGPCSRADLARSSGLSKPTVSLALANVERAGLVRTAGRLTGAVRAKTSRRAKAAGALGRVAELVSLAVALAEAAGLTRASMTQVVIGSPGIYDPRRDAIAFTGSLAGWALPAVLARLRAAFGPELMVENDVDAAALAEQAHGHGHGVGSFALVH